MQMPINRLLGTGLLLAALLLPGAAVADDDSYRTPLAGEPFATTLLGEQVSVRGRDRANILSLSLGGALFVPSSAGTDALPIAALYWRRETAAARSRLAFSVFYNDWDAALKLGDGLELLGHLETFTNPFPQQELLYGRPFKSSSAYWGFVDTWLGLGYRHPVAPYQSDNDLRLQLFCTGGYHYASRSGDTGQDVTLPPSTWVNGVRLRLRYDGIRRNILELPHSGYAAGADLEWARRSRWGDSNYGELTFRKETTQEFLKLSGYAMAALPVPGLSERDRLLLSIYGGYSPNSNLDRFSGFRIGGGPFPYESDDLWRVPYPGAVFNQFVVSDYIVTTAEYRRELLFFLYLHLRGTLTWINRDFSRGYLFDFSEDRGEALSVGLSSGLPWDSTIYLEYSNDYGMLRSGTKGSSVLLLWSKMF